MFTARWSVIVILALLPMAVIAEETSRQSGPANPDEVVASPVYESAFRDYRVFVESKESSATAWRAANDEMGRLGGHVGQTGKGPAPVKPEMPDPAPMPAGHAMPPKTGGK